MPPSRLRDDLVQRLPVFVFGVGLFAVTDGFRGSEGLFLRSPVVGVGLLCLGVVAFVGLRLKQPRA